MSPVFRLLYSLKNRVESWQSRSHTDFFSISPQCEAWYQADHFLEISMGYSLGECAFLVSPVVKKGIHFLITLTVVGFL